METASILITVVLAVFVLAEAAWARLVRPGVYHLRESLANLAILVVSNLIKPLTVAWSLLILSLLEPLQMFRLPDTAWTIGLTFVAADFAYYWYHRLSHEWPPLWALHHTHHSSPWMNLTTAFRLNWLGKFVTPMFFIPLVLLGMSPAVLAGSLAVILLFQFFLHTEAIGRLGCFEGKLLNTPSAHRVHHGSNPRYIDRNYAGVFIVWDRWLGSYTPEVEPVRYGVTSGFVGHNPLAIQFRPLWQYTRGQLRREKPAAARPGPSRSAAGRRGRIPAGS